jgi:hypothetical protein
MAQEDISEYLKVIPASATTVLCVGRILETTCLIQRLSVYTEHVS